MVYSLDGFSVWSWGTVSDVDGVDTGMDVAETSCVLSGLTGDLSKGEEPGKGLCWYNSYRSEAIVRMGESFTWRVIGHGWGCQSVEEESIEWWNNPVNAQATCFLKGASLTGYWTPDMYAFTRISELVPGRQCFLSGVVGATGTWDSQYSTVRIIKGEDSHAKRSLYPSGWYIESNLQKSAWGSNPEIHYLCVDFPTNYQITKGTITKTQIARLVKITSGSGIKACALTEISGAFNVGSWTDGVVMTFPSTLSGDWYLSATAGKAVSWVCVK